MCTYINTEAHHNLGQILPFDLLFISALKLQETSSVNVGISNPTAPLTLKVRDGVLLPDVRPGLLRTVQEFLHTFGELFTVLEQRGESVTPPVEGRPCRTKTFCPELDFGPSF